MNEWIHFKCDAFQLLVHIIWVMYVDEIYIERDAMPEINICFALRAISGWIWCLLCANYIYSCHSHVSINHTDSAGQIIIIPRFLSIQIKRPTAKKLFVSFYLSFDSRLFIRLIFLSHETLKPLEREGKRVYILCVFHQ